MYTLAYDSKKYMFTGVKCWQSYLSNTMVRFTILTGAIIYIISLWCCFCFIKEGKVNILTYVKFKNLKKENMIILFTENTTIG